MRSLSIMWVAALVLSFAGSALALDPRDTAFSFDYSLYPPGGVNPKRMKIVPRGPVDKARGAVPLLNASGKFDPWGQWYFRIASDPACFEKWWLGYWTDPAIWSETENFVYQGWAPGHQGHRIIAFIGTFNRAVQSDPDIDEPIKKMVCNDAWKRAVETIIRTKTIDPQTGLLAYRLSDSVIHRGNMAQTFHFLRTKFGAMQLNVANIYQLHDAQNLAATLLTAPNIIWQDDRWMTPRKIEWLEALGPQKGGTESDVRWVKDGQVLFTGGLFIGWNDKPSLHGTWDGLTIINTLFKFYPDPDPNSPHSIFYRWNQLPQEKKQIAKTMIMRCAQRLWLGWKEHNEPIWCWVYHGRPTSDSSTPSEAPWRPAYDGYGDNQLGWAQACWEEMFGEPTRNTTDGCQALLAIARGSILKQVKTPLGQQVPGRYDFGKDVMLKSCLDDLARLGPAPEKRHEFEARMKAWGLLGAAETTSDEPKLDPKKSATGHE